MNNELTLKEAIKGFRKKEFKSEELVEQCLKTIKAKDKFLNAFLELNEDVLSEARKKDKSKPLGIMHGIPIAVKDNFLTKGLRTTASSNVLRTYVPQYSATVVDKLVKSGAILIGKTNMDAWAHGSSTETSDFGPTKNPWDLGRLPGGSSGGSAAAVVSDMCIAAIGTETAGSLRGPAAWCGCVGFKPTYGRVSRYGVIAMGSSLDSPGPLAKTVEDAVIVYNVIAGKDPYDSTTYPQEAVDLNSFIGKSIKGFKIGIAEDYFLPGMDKRMKDGVLQAAKIFESMGAKVDYVKTMDPQFAISVYTIVQRSEVSSNLARFDGIRFGNDRSYFGDEAKRRIMLGTFSLSTGYADKYYKNALKVRAMFIKDFERIFNSYDLLIGPTMPGPAPKIGITKGADMYGEMADVLTEPTSIAGLPGISVPCGFIDNLPVGLDIIGPQFAEGKIVQAAYAYEKSTKWNEQKPDLKIYEN